MKYYWLVPKDQRCNNFVFFREMPKRLMLRENYRPLQCSCCGKFDEDAALCLPIDRDVKIHAKSSFVGTNDGLICMSDALRQIIVSSGITGLDFLALPGDSRYWIANPICLVATDTGTAGFQYQGDPKGNPCSCCGRWRGIHIRPMLASMTLPHDPKTIFAPDVWQERLRNRETLLMCSEVVMKILKDHKVSGLEYCNEPLV